MKAGYAKNSRFSTEAKEHLAFFRSHCRLPTVSESDCFLAFEQKKRISFVKIFFMDKFEDNGLIFLSLFIILIYADFTVDFLLNNSNFLL